jgi:hypothetical protein
MNNTHEVPHYLAITIAEQAGYRYASRWNEKRLTAYMNSTELANIPDEEFSDHVQRQMKPIRKAILTSRGINKVKVVITGWGQKQAKAGEQLKSDGIWLHETAVKELMRDLGYGSVKIESFKTGQELAEWLREMVSKPGTVDKLKERPDQQDLALTIQRSRGTRLHLTMKFDKLTPLLKYKRVTQERPTKELPISSDAKRIEELEHELFIRDQLLADQKVNIGIEQARTKRAEEAIARIRSIAMQFVPEGVVDYEKPLWKPFNKEKPAPGDQFWYWTFGMTSPTKFRYATGLERIWDGEGYWTDNTNRRPDPPETLIP